MKKLAQPFGMKQARIQQGRDNYMILPNIFVGIDISKKHLDVHFNPLNKSFRIENSAAGIEALLKNLSFYKVNQIVCESSGGYEHLLIKTLRDAQYKVWHIDPKQIKAFVKSQGVKAKTDKIDAKMMALFASKNQPQYQQNNKSEQLEILSALVRRRTDLTDIGAMEKKRLSHPSQMHCKKDIQDHINFIEKQIKELEKEIDKIIDNDDDLKKKSNLMQTMPGIGKVTASALISEMPELGVIPNKQAAALVGVVPYPQESGSYKGEAHIEGGRKMMRHILYMSCLSACKYNPKFKEFYQRLKNSGKKSKVAMVAVMRKMIEGINTILYKNETWRFPV
jgi:transposase